MKNNSCNIPSAPDNLQYEPKPLFGKVNVNGRAIGLFRICFATFLIYDLLLNILPYWDFLYSSHGVLTAKERGTNVFWSFFSYSDNPFIQNIIIGILFISLLGMLIGYHARVFSFISFLIFFSITDRLPDADSGADVLSNCLLLWASFLPLDRYYSLAAALRGEAERDKPWPVVMASAIKVQISIVYLYAGLFKIAGPNWTEGLAIKYAVSDEIYGTELGKYVVSLIPDMFMTPLCWGVIIFQLSFSFLVYMPFKNDIFRAIAILGAVLMHLGFLFFLHVNMFPFLCLIYLILLVPDKWIQAAFAKRAARISKIRIYYDPDCGFCRAVSYIFREFFLNTSAKIAPAHEDEHALKLLQAHNSWVVFGHDDKTYLKWNGVAYVMRQSPIFWWLGVLTGSKLLKMPMEWLYDCIGKKRYILSLLFAPILRGYAEEKPERMTQFACLYLVLCLLSYNTATLPQINLKLPHNAELAMWQMGIQQKWDLFAPEVTSWKWHMRVRAVDKNELPVYLDNILYNHFIYSNGYYDFYSHRVLKLYTRMFPENAEYLQRGYARYLCYRTAKEDRPATQVFLEFQIEHKFENRSGPKITRNYNCAGLLDKI